MPKTIYPTLALALTRVNALKTAGIWTAYYKVKGGWSLAYDPPVAVTALNRFGYVR